MRQLPLGVRLQDRALFESFLTGANGQALAASQALAAGSDSLLYLHGIEASGKSHLLQAMCAACAGAAYLPLRTLRALAPEALEGLAGLPLLAIDDPEAIAGEMLWEQQLFSLYNECMAAGTRIAVAARMPAVDLPLVLPDLRSRLAAMPHFALRPLDEAQQRSALLARAAARGIQLPEDAVHYLQRRFARDMASLSQILERLDAASLEAKRPLTLPFIRSVLGDAP